MGRVIAISGKIGTGKTPLADALASAFPMPVLNFADALKEEVASIFGIDIGLLNSRAGKQTPIVPTRQQWDELGRRITAQTGSQISILPYGGLYLEKKNAGVVRIVENQALATQTAPPITLGQLLQFVGSAFRWGKPDYWIARLSAKAMTYGSFIIADMRYDNEYKWICQQPDHTTIRLFSEVVAQDSRNKQHISECDLDDAQFDIVANILKPSGDALVLNGDAINRIIEAIRERK